MLKQLVLYHWKMVCCAGYKSQPATSLGRPVGDPLPVNTRLATEIGVNGAPERYVYTPVTSQPLTN